MAPLSDDELRRYCRQLLLPEVSGAGQERLRGAQAEAASEVEALYLAAAGVGTLRVPSETIRGAVLALNPQLTVALSGRPPAPDSVAVAAERALATLRGLLWP